MHWDLLEVPGDQDEFFWAMFPPWKTAAAINKLMLDSLSNCCPTICGIYGVVFFFLIVTLQFNRHLPINIQFYGNVRRSTSSIERILLRLAPTVLTWWIICLSEFNIPILALFRRAKFGAVANLLGYGLGWMVQDCTVKSHTFPIMHHVQ